MDRHWRQVSYVSRHMAPKVRMPMCYATWYGITPTEGNASMCKAQACSSAMHLQDSATAKTLAFHKEVRTRCVTLEGDDFNPSGTLTGTSSWCCQPSADELPCSYVVLRWA